jgi:uroporphyrinogen III methyltransferase/synthase
VRVVNTRGLRQAGQLDALLKERSAISVPYPCIEVAPLLDPGPLDEALTRVAGGAFEWLVFTSANAVEAVDGRLRHLGLRPKQMAGIRVAAVGPGTAVSLADRLGLTAEMWPEEYRAEALARQLLGRGAQTILIPQAERAREALVRILAESGVDVEVVTAYRTVLGSGGADVPGLAREGRVDAIAFTSPSTVDNMAVRFERENGDWDDLKRVCVACIGPITSAAAERRGLQVHVLAREHTISGLVDGLERYYRDNARIGDGEQAP